MLLPFHDDNPTVRTPVVMYGIVVVNVLAFLLTLSLSPVGEQELVYQRGFMPARLAQLVHGEPITVPIERVGVDRWGQVVQFEQPLKLPPARGQILLSLLTCMFLHGGWLHLIGNMWFLWIFGNNVEDRLGHVAFLLFYLGGGLLASGAHWLVDPSSTTPVIGASGAIAAILGAYAITWPWARVHTLVFLFVFITVIDVPAMLVLGIWFVGQFISSGQQLQDAAGVAWWAHIGGFIAGLLLMPLVDALLHPGRRQRVSDFFSYFRP
jgi:membrane associated rhomboid family serine protease